MRSHRRVIAAAVAGLAAVLLGPALAVPALVVPVAAAAPGDSFYTPPATIPAAGGSVIKTRPTPLFLQIPGGNPRSFPGRGTTVMYTSTTQDGAPTAVTGTLIEPVAPWRGRGPRPTVVMAPGTIGQGDQCAPSKSFALGVSIDPAQPSIAINYEATFANALLAAGMTVFMTDYIGLGTPGVHTYVNRVEEGHAVLDGARAALALGEKGPTAPVGFWGYSQGGGATASAAELAAGYAPELNVKGTYAGAPPANLTKVLSQVDGTSIVGVIGYTVNGLVARYPELAPIIDREASPAGKQILRTLSTDCVADSFLRYAFRRTNEWTATGQSLSQIAARYPQIQAALDDQLIGRIKPTGPVLVDTAVNDDIIPHGQVLEMVAGWRARGGDVRVITDGTPPILPRLAANHALPYLFSALPALRFLYDRFDAR